MMIVNGRLPEQIFNDTRKLLLAMISDDACEGYIRFAGNGKVCLDGDFSAEDLRALALCLDSVRIMQKMKEA